MSAAPQLHTPPAARHTWPPRLPGRYLPRALQSRGASLLNLQCWLWGQDIKQDGGNLLLAAGMVRQRPPAGMNGCSQYTVMLGRGKLLRVWGFGIYCGTDTGCYLGRFDFVPRFATGEDQWNPRTLATGRRTACIGALLPALRWISAYETNVITTLGADYRRNVAIGGPAPVDAAMSLGDLWYDLLADIGRATPAAPTGPRDRIRDSLHIHPTRRSYAR